MRKLWSAALVVAAISSGAQAQTIAPAPAAVPATEGWQFSLSPYLWIAGLSGNVTTPLVTPSGTRVRGEFGNDNLISSVSGFAFMAAGEARYGRFGVVADLMTVTLSDDFNTPRNTLFNGGNSRINTTMLSVLGLYRLVEEPGGTVDFGAGVRPWWISTRQRLNAGLLPGTTVKASDNWTDPIIAIRGHLPLSASWGLSAYADIGGFGVGSQLTWQVLGTVDWRPASWVDIRAGWRYLALDFDRGRITLDTAMSGPILGATFRF